jgi:hypothetical protein
VLSCTYLSTTTHRSRNGLPNTAKPHHVAGQVSGRLFGRSDVSERDTTTLLPTKRSRRASTFLSLDLMYIYVHYKPKGAGSTAGAVVAGIPHPRGQTNRHGDAEAA